MKETMKQAEKLEKLLNWAMGVSIALLGVSSAIMSIAGIAGFALPDWLIRVLGIVSLLSLPVLVYSTVKKALNAKKLKEQPVRTAATNGVKKPKKKKRKK